jgi:hypothetical protein
VRASFRKSKHLIALPFLFMAVTIHAEGPAIIDLCEDDLGDNGAATLEHHPSVARQIVDCRQMRVGGLRAAIFRTYHVAAVKKGKPREGQEDHAFRVFAPEAAANGLRVGAYYFYQAGPPVEQQVREYLDVIRRACALKREDSASGSPERPLENAKILLVVDSWSHDQAKDESDVSVLRRTLAVIREVHRQSGTSEETRIWPLYYPEMGSIPKVFAGGWKNLTEAEKEDFRKCPLWISSYSRILKSSEQKKEDEARKARLARMEPLTFDFGEAWGGWCLWQYCPAEYWQRQIEKKKRWQPFYTSPEKQAALLHSDWLSLQEYPRGIMGSAIPLDCNYWNPTWNSQVRSVEQFWEKYGWVADGR